MSVPPITYECLRALDCETKDDVEPGPSGWTTAICLEAGPPVGGGEWILCAEAVVGAGNIFPCLWCRVGDYVGEGHPFNILTPPGEGYTVHDLATISGCDGAYCYNPETGMWRYDTCTCAYCPRGYVYNYATDECDPTDTYCPEGQCWCETLELCVPCPPPDCLNELECVWLPAACSWACELPDCPEGHDWDEGSCSCGVGECPSGEGWCEVVGECVPQPGVRCREARDCTWDTEWCAWVCNTPVCADGSVWTEAACTCLPPCPAGQQWCDLESACVEAEDPPCLIELNCLWNPTTCEWECEEPPCASWDWDTCECGPALQPWNLETQPGWYHVAHAEEGAIRYRRSSRVYGPPWTVDVTATAPGEGEVDTYPRMILDRRQTIRLVFVRTGGVWLTQSNDDGATWSDPVELFANAVRPTLNVHTISRRILYAALRVDAEDPSGGVLVGRQQGSGENEPGEEFTLQRWDVEAEEWVDFTADTDTFHFSPAPGSEDRWLLVCAREGAVVSFYSTDDGRTWRPVPEPA